jgi:hypothetical protein
MRQVVNIEQTESGIPDLLRSGNCRLPRISPPREETILNGEPEISQLPGAKFGYGDTGSLWA